MGYSKKDKGLINEANELDCIDWSLAYNLANLTESKEAKEVITSHAKRLYHQEEGANI